jgi:hypothetical protein
MNIPGASTLIVGAATFMPRNLCHSVPGATWIVKMSTTRGSQRSVLRSREFEKRPWTDESLHAAHEISNLVREMNGIRHLGLHLKTPLIA